MRLSQITWNRILWREEISLGSQFWKLIKPRRPCLARGPSTSNTTVAPSWQEHVCAACGTWGESPHGTWVTLQQHALMPANPFPRDLSSSQSTFQDEHSSLPRPTSSWHNPPLSFKGAPTSEHLLVRSQAFSIWVFQGHKTYSYQIHLQ